jgi:hypothetical protein
VYESQNQNLFSCCRYLIKQHPHLRLSLNTLGGLCRSVRAGDFVNLLLDNGSDINPWWHVESEGLGDLGDVKSGGVEDLGVRVEVVLLKEGSIIVS